MPSAAIAGRNQVDSESRFSSSSRQVSATQSLATPAAVIGRSTQSPNGSDIGHSISRQNGPSTFARINSPSHPMRSVTPPPTSVVPRASREARRSFQSAPSNSQRASNRANRLSGFFSGLRPKPQLPQTQSAAVQRPHPPRPPAKPQEPSPPSLEPPTLDELGLTLNVLTPSLFPSHFVAPPTSGIFMPPNYVLLCHSQGLDVLPLRGPPASQAYALVRRVPFKSVVIMEARGVLVAIAGRHEGVRVYALEEVRRAIDWRIDMEIQRENEKNRRDQSKIRPLPSPVNNAPEPIGPPSGSGKSSSNPRPSEKPGIPPSSRRSPPPTYSSISEPPRVINRIPSASIPAAAPSSLTVPGSSQPNRDRGVSVSSLMQGGGAEIGEGALAPPQDGVTKKEEWEHEGSDDEEALVAAGPSGSAALDARTSAMPTSSSQPMIPSASGQLPENTEDQEASDVEAERDAERQREADPQDRPSRTSQTSVMTTQSSTSVNSFTPTRRRRPASLRLQTVPSTYEDPGLEDDTIAGLENYVTPIPTAESAPSPTVYALQRSISQAPPPSPQMRRRTSTARETERNDSITFAQALMESRLPNVRPSPFARLPTASHRIYDPTSNNDGSGDHDDDTADEGTSTPLRVEPPTPSAPSAEPRARRRWSMMGGTWNDSRVTISESQRAAFRPGDDVGVLGPAATSHDLLTVPHATAPIRSTPTTPSRSTTNISSTANGGPRSAPLTQQRSSSSGALNRSPSMPSHRIPPNRAPSRMSTFNTGNPRPQTPTPMPANGSYSSPAPTRSLPRRFLPKIFNALRSASSGDRDRERGGDPYGMNGASSETDGESPMTMPPAGSSFGFNQIQSSHVTPPPKLEYVKLPGTEKALMIKAVETPKKSFLAILCGENGEKVELFAGTYRTALGLSRTFILPDSPRSLELQLQGDDLVELFLMFSQNVFGLEPATVRVREVRIGRAERRARRRAAARENEILGGEGAGGGREGASIGDDAHTTQVIASVSVGDPTGGQNGLSSAVGPNVDDESRMQSSGQLSRGATRSSNNPEGFTPPKPRTPQQGSPSVADTSMSGFYTTFQQLSFAPNFPIAIIADEYTIPPTYLDFVTYKGEHEKDLDMRDYFGDGPSNDTDGKVPRSPPGLTTSPRWVYLDPIGILRGPWEATVMQKWLQEGYLPPNLPLRREFDIDFMTLKNLQAASPTPHSPFEANSSSAPSSRPHTPALAATSSAAPVTMGPSPWIPIPKLLLSPTSLLTQPRYYGPPALFFSTRGGHSTAIVDARGRSVLKGRMMWNGDESDDVDATPGFMGDVKRVEAFDTKNRRAVAVALRQGGLEAVDMGDALLQPADESRSSLPMFASPASATSRRRNFVWRLGSAVEDVSNQYHASSSLGISSTTETVLLRKGGTNVIGRKFPGKRSVGGSGGRDPLRDNMEPNSLSPEEDILFLGRNHDVVYMCERSLDSFRILCLAPSQ